MLDFIGLFVVVISFFLLLAVIVNQFLKKEKLHYDGQIVVTVQKNGKKIFSLEFEGDPYEDLENKEFVTFKVVEAEPSID